MESTFLTACIIFEIFITSNAQGQTINAGLGMSSNRTSDYFLSATNLVNGWGCYVSAHRNACDKAENSCQDLSGIADRISRFRCYEPKDYYETYSGISAGVNVRLTKGGSKFPAHFYFGLGNYDKTEYRKYGVLYEFNSTRESYQRNEWVIEAKYKVFFVESLLSVSFPLSEHVYFSTITGFNTNCWWLGYLCLTLKFEE